MIRDPLIAEGAGLAARSQDQLLVGLPRGPGGEELSPVTSDEYRGLAAIGFGDPYQFAGPGQRIPMAAFGYWENSRAATGEVIDGRATLWFAGDGRIVLRVEPADGSPPLDLPVDGVPVVATRCPLQRHAGWQAREAPLAECLPEPVRYAVDQARTAMVPVSAAPIMFERGYAGYSLDFGGRARIDVTGAAAFAFPTILVAPPLDPASIRQRVARQLDLDEPPDVVTDFDCRYLASATAADRYRRFRAARGA
jgi:hypothetical protein